MSVFISDKHLLASTDIFPNASEHRSFMHRKKECMQDKRQVCWTTRRIHVYKVGNHVLYIVHFVIENASDTNGVGKEQFIDSCTDFLRKCFKAGEHFFQL